MSIDIYFSATVSNAEQILYLVETIAEEQTRSFERDENWIRVDFCPMGGLYFELDDQVLLHGECQTNLCGPGFHAAVVSFLAQLEKMAGIQLEVQDDTGYYQHRNFAELQQHFYNWLGNIMEICAQQYEQNGHSFYICWDIHQYQPQISDGYMVTPFGPWEISKLLGWVEQEGILPFANAFFLWNQQEQDGLYYHNTALHLLWEHCCFVPADRAERDYRLQEQILDLLELSMELKPGLPIPKEAYLLLCQYNLREPQVLSNIPDLETSIPIGYRRGLVTWTLGSLHYTLPGSFLMEEDEDDLLWYDDAPSWHTVRITGWEIKEDKAAFSDQVFASFDPAVVTTMEAGEGYCRFCYAGTAEEQGNTFHQSIGQIICAKQTFFITVSYQDETEQQWASDFFSHVEATMPQEIIPKTMITDEAGNLVEAEAETEF